MASHQLASYTFTPLFCFYDCLIFGAKGYLGQHFVSLYPDAICPEVDIASHYTVSELLYDYKPDVVINCAGKTGRPNVDWCENHKLETVHSNVVGPLTLLELCSKYGIYWVHVGSGCIYQGDNGGQGFSEEDLPNFQGSFYSRTKASIDHLLNDFEVLNLRLRMPFDDTLHPRSLIAKLSQYPKVLDEQNSLTYLPDMLKATEQLVKQRTTGTFNMVNPGSMSPYHIMELWQEIVDPDHSFERLTLADLPAVTKAGRSNCILSTDKLEREGIHLLPVKKAVKQALTAIAKLQPAEKVAALAA